MTDSQLTSVIVRQSVSPADASVEIVERKGLGHPDTLADALAERLSVAYSEHCLNEHGAVLHHNLDKLYIRGGHASVGLGRFAMEDPVTVLFGGRVSECFDGRPIGYRDLFEEVTTAYLRAVLPALDVEPHLRFEHATTARSKYGTWFHPQSLDDLPERAAPTSSDTVAVTAWWPNTPVEDLVLALERHLNHEAQGRRHGALGQDIKVLAYRHEQRIRLTMSVPVFPHAAASVADYETIIASAQAELQQVADSQLPLGLRCRVELNSSTANPFGGKKQYLLGTGSCIECGEEGFVGRGNTAAGMIPQFRPKSVEAPFGKNPTYHAGKVYTIYALDIARAIHDTLGTAASVTIVARHSAPLRRPAAVILDLHGEANHQKARRVAHDILATTDHLHRAIHDRALVPR